MTFEEFLNQLTEEYKNPEDGDADRNGNTRLAVLQDKYHLSSLKVQKLLVTAGVFVPVKTDSNYYAVKKLHEAGKSAKEIVQETGLSTAAVNAFLPYEKGAMNLDKLGVKISDDAARKRKQRRQEEMKKENAREVLVSTMTDDALWAAIGEHDQETFITGAGERFHVNSIHGVQGKLNGTVDVSDQLIFSVLGKDSKVARIESMSKVEVMDVFHKSVLFAAEDMDEMADEVHIVGNPYLRALFIFLGVLEGDKQSVTTKRSIPEERRCACCGRLTDQLYQVSSFDDLVILDKQFTAQREAGWTEREKQIAKAYNSLHSKEQAEWEKRKEKQLEKARNSKAVETFNEEGVRKLCQLCAQTIYMALEKGDAPYISRPLNYDDWSVDELTPFYYKRTEEPDCRYTHDTDRIYKAVDVHGVEHIFALTYSLFPYSENDTGLGFDATEIHKLTKVGKLAVQNADTDYHIEHFKMCYDGENIEQKKFSGVLELMDIVADVLRTETLEESQSPASNHITVNGKHYSIRSNGTIRLVYVGDAGEYMSMRDREWKGGRYGFLIDGKLFSGEELALIFSCDEGAQIQYYVEDPSGHSLRADEQMMPVRLSERSLIDDTLELINMFSHDGEFISPHDQENFHKLFEKNVLPKLQLYHNSRPRGFGKLAGMEIIKRLQWVEGTEFYQDKVRAIIR